MPARRRNRLRGPLLNLHLYLGLICAPYFALLGLSGLAYNHEKQLPTNTGTSEWSASVMPVESSGSVDVVAAGVRDELGLLGYVWGASRGEGGALAFRIGRPGRQYEVAVAAGAVMANVRETRTGIWGVLRKIHGPIWIAGAPIWSSIWRVYTELAMGSLVFALASGLVLWWPRRTERLLGATLFATGTGVLIALALWVAG